MYCSFRVDEKRVDETEADPGLRFKWCGGQAAKKCGQERCKSMCKKDPKAGVGTVKKRAGAVPKDDKNGAKVAQKWTLEGAKTRAEARAKSCGEPMGSNAKGG
ncbi:hypothetical protein DFH07DRAFT_771606 [Mycena maculata]|uniref:Uncharacterized protein n=1 Tax=Mycena maculata TaxID=230809 RepID=A0AAD7JBG7_9AGAR|nr:hypothetical protein DFH07DRAFT_779435 [Mycena maculata]KAJ7752172.1 hypothetical protein DFH07DRAFT_774460 [Mycena maculata]KAJ7761282.1 hypothetical protein DFH07DRAFT_771606 [Mycena maculata]